MSGTLPSWLERWLGVETPGRGEGTVWSLEHTWGWAPWATLVAAALVVLWVLYFYRREGPLAGRFYKGVLAGARLLAIGLVALMIAELSLGLRRTGLPSVVVLLDDSASMGLADKLDDQSLASLIERRVTAAGLKDSTRLNQAKTVLLGKDSDLLAALDRRYRLKTYFVASSARAQAGSLSEVRRAVEQSQASGESSRLGDAVRSVLADQRGTPPAALVVLTDGVTTDGESLGEAARLARRKGVPIFAVALGSEKPVRDLELSDLLVDDVVFVDDVVNFEFKLTGTGLAGKSVEIALHEKGANDVLAWIKATVGRDGEPQKLVLPYRPTKVGQFQYVVEVERLGNETKVTNNEQQRLVTVRKELVRVLLVQSYPSYEFRYLKNMLQRDSTIELKSVLQEADPEYVALDKTALAVFPVRREELFEYDVLILGDVNPSLLTPTAIGNVAAFVEEKGGGLALVAGPQFMPLAYRNTALAPLVPIDLASAAVPETSQSIAAGFQVQPTDLGLSSPQMQLGDTTAESAALWKNLPPIYWLLRAPQWKPATRVLAEHPTELTAEGRRLPVFCMQYYGKGKVLFHATDETWRWRYRVGDVLFARYWVQAVRYLSRSKLLGKDRAAELSVDKRQYHRGESVRLRTRFLDDRQAPADDDGVTVIVQRAGQPNQKIRLQRNAANRGVFEGTLAGLLDGQYHAWLATPSLEGKAPATDFLVVAPPGEFERVEMDWADLVRAAEESRGKVYRIGTAGKLVRDLPPGRQVPIEALSPLVLWNQWWVLLALLMVLVTEWILRKRKGML